MNPVSLQKTEDHTSKTFTCSSEALKFKSDSLNPIKEKIKYFFQVFFQNIASFSMCTLELNKSKSNRVTFTLEKPPGCE